MKHTPKVYFKAVKPSQGLLMMLDSMDEFIRYVTFSHSNAIFILKDEEKKFFACLHQGTLFAYNASGYDTIEDYTAAMQNRFTDAATFYEAKKEGYNNFDDYKLVKEAGISDLRIFEKMKTQGYIAGYEEFNSIRNRVSLLNDLSNPYQLYKYASEQSFNDFAQFKEAFSLGFTDPATFKIATEKNFKDAADYKKGQKMGFIHGSEFYKAIEINAVDYADYSKFMELEYIYKDKIEFHDERVLVDILSKLSQGKKVSLNKLNDHLKTTLATYLNDDGRMPSWFTLSLKTPADVARFLAVNEVAKTFGVYDSEGEYFETLQMNKRKVVIDGANIAFNSNGNEKAKPTLVNVINLVNTLKQKGFDEIAVISDASLKHRLIDKEKMAQLEKLCRYSEAPAETPADAYLITYVKLHRCLLVTNDTFRDWKLRDQWVAKNIDYYKLSFMIDGDKVIMPDLENIVAGDKVLSK